MIEYKRISFKYVVLAFMIAACLIVLLSVDRKNNEAPPIEDVYIEELFKPQEESVETSLIHEVKDGENLSIIFEDYRVPLNTVYKILKLDRSNELKNINRVMKLNFLF